MCSNHGMYVVRALPDSLIILYILLRHSNCLLYISLFLTESQNSKTVNDTTGPSTDGKYICAYIYMIKLY